MRRMGIICIVLVLVSCTGPGGFRDIGARKAIQSGEISIGCSKTDVARAMGSPATWGCQKKKVTSDGTMELWDYASRNCGANLTEAYAFVFKDDRLIEIRTVRGPLDLQL